MIKFSEPTENKIDSNRYNELESERIVSDI